MTASPEKENVVSLVSRDYGKDGLKLRDYQSEGIRWLIRTWQRGNRDGGLLCDDMGLGKTCQVIHLLKYVHCVENATKPSIVVVPLSVFKNWQEEFEMWGPKLDLRVYSGSKDERPAIQEDITDDLKRSGNRMVIVCTPELLINDQEFFSTLSYAVLVFDEAQRVKNSESMLYKICAALQRHSTILMTGTPVQNNVRELYALLALAAPIKFEPSDTDSFICRYSNLVGNEGLQKQLQSEIASFMLRRLKSDVEPNLPSRGVIHLYVTLTDLQKKLYRSILARNIEALTGGIKNSRNNVQNALVSLRKCVDHPYLFDGVEPEPFEAGEHLVTASGKLVVLDKLLTFLKPLGHRVLVFSQMTHMLDVLQDYLTFRKYLYERLDGSVRGEERYLAISKFCKGGKHEDSPFVFLLSTRAGGVGLNLVSADTVVLFDSDMNPQNDLQAIARAHRIGQTKPVRVIRFVARHTVEENILRRQSAKICLSEAVIGGASSAQSSTLPSFDSKEWWKEVLRIGLDKLFDEKKSDDETVVDFNAILGRTDNNGCWKSMDEENVVPDAILAKGEAEKETKDLTSEDLTAPLVERLQQEAKQIRGEEAAQKMDLLPEGKRKSKKTEFLADEMLTEELTRESKPKKHAPRVDPAIRRAQAKEKLWQRLNYQSLNLPLPTVDLNSSNPLDNEAEEDENDSGVGIRFVAGDVTKPEYQALPQGAKSNHCIVFTWVDDGGSWGSGGVFTAVDSSLGDKPGECYELASEAKDLNMGDVHLCKKVASCRDVVISCALVVCQHRKPSGEQKPIDLLTVERGFKRVKHFVDSEMERDKSVALSVHLPRIGRGPLAAKWYGIERLVRKWFGHGPAVPYVYYYSRTKNVGSDRPEAEGDSKTGDSKPQDEPGPSSPVAGGIFSNLEFCLKFLPEGCRALTHIQQAVKRLGGQVVDTPVDSSACFIVVDRSEFSDQDKQEVSKYSQSQAVHYSWIYACEKRNQLVATTQFEP